MHNILDLTKIMVEKKLIDRGTNISAKITVSAFGNVLTTKEKEGKVLAVKEDGLKVDFEGRTRHANFEDITSIEGMDVARFAQAYKLKTKVKTKKK
jgi:hypothetical protein